MLEIRPRHLYHHDASHGENPLSPIPNLLTELRALQQTTNLTPEEQEDDMYYEQYITNKLDKNIVDTATGQTASQFLRQHEMIVLKVGSFAHQDSDHNGRAGEIAGSVLFLGDHLGGITNIFKVSQLKSITRAFAMDQAEWPARSGVYRPYFYTGMDLLTDIIRQGKLEVRSSFTGTRTDFGTVIARIITGVPLYSEDQELYDQRQQTLLGAIYGNSAYNQKITQILTGHLDKRKRRRGM